MALIHQINHLLQRSESEALLGDPNFHTVLLQMSSSTPRLLARRSPDNLQDIFFAEAVPCCAAFLLSEATAAITRFVENAENRFVETARCCDFLS